MKSELDPAFHELLPLTIGEDKFQELLHAGAIADGRAGGVILGRDDLIFTLFKFGTEYIIQFCTRGGAFVLNKEASTAHYGRLKAIASGIGQPKPQVGAEGFSRLICTTGEPDDKLLWVDWCQTIIPPEKASDHLLELEGMNRSANPYAQCDLTSFFPAEASKFR